MTSIQVEGLTLEQETELMNQDRGKDFASMTERLGRLEELARLNQSCLTFLLCICRVGAARTCHHLLKAGLRCSGKLNGHILMITNMCHNKIQGVRPLLH